MVDPFLEADMQQNDSGNKTENSGNENQKSQSGNGNKQTLSSLGEQGGKTNNGKVVSKVKKGKTVGMRNFLIGCGFFGVLIMVLLMSILFWLMNAPDALKEFGIQQGDVKMLLMLFAGLFFGILFFLGFYILVVNIFRFFGAKKNRSKFGVGTVIGFVLLMFSITTGSFVFINIMNVDDGNTTNSQNLVDPYVVGDFGGGKIEKSLLEYKLNSKLVAPLWLKYALNKNIFNKEVVGRIGGLSNLNGLELDCGNSNVLGLSVNSIFANSSSQIFFNGECLYVNKGSYDVSLIVYSDSSTQGEQTEKLKLFSINVAGELMISAGDNIIEYDNQQIQVGRAPVELALDASNLLTELNLDNNEIEWEIDGKTYDSQYIIHTFEDKEGGRKKGKFRYPNLSNEWYYLEFVVQSSNLLGCSVQLDKLSGDKYLAKVNKYDKKPESVTFSLKNADGEEVDNDVVNKLNTKFSIKTEGKYKLYADYVTENGENGSCASDYVNVYSDNFNINYNLQLSKANEDDFEKLNMEEDSVEINIIPGDFLLTFEDIETTREDLEYKISFDGKSVSETKDGFKFEIKNEGEYELDISLMGGIELLSKKSVKISAKQKPVIAKLRITPIEGEEPLLVELDASGSILNEDGDSIKYFSWDFDDGSKQLKNLKSGKQQHEYSYDYKNENGRFCPIITVETFNGYTDTYQTNDCIVLDKKLNEFDIIFTSHSGQVAKVNEIVEFMVDVDGKIESIKWDFDDGKDPLEGRGREYQTMSNVFTKPGEYQIRVIVKYENADTIQEIKTLVIEEE